jgi:hypothetical protein
MHWKLYSRDPKTKSVKHSLQESWEESEHCLQVEWHLTQMLGWPVALRSALLRKKPLAQVWQLLSSPKKDSQMLHWSKLSREEEATLN